MTVINRYVKCENEQDVQMFLDECLNRGNIINVEEIRELVEKGVDGDGEIVRVIGINTDNQWNHNKGADGEWSVTYMDSPDYWEEQPHMHEYTPYQGSLQGMGENKGDISLSLLEYYAGMNMAQLVKGANDSRFYTVPESVEYYKPYARVALHAAKALIEVMNESEEENDG